MIDPTAPPSPASSSARSVPLAGDPAITPALLKQHKISRDEYARIEGALGRAPTYTELGVFSVMWSEHCSYKSSRVHLKRLPTTGPQVIQGPGENAGVVDLGDGFCAVFKIESHNHPSSIEPYQGAATGVGGILRDVFTMGARPVAALNSLRFGRPSHPRTPELLRGVVAGIAGYGNAFGVPTVGGELAFDPAYDDNCLVNAFTCGVARTDRLFFGRAAGVGNPILYVGSKTGRDGIHGATMASDAFGGDDTKREAASAEAGDAQLATAASIKKGERSTVQVGDPFTGKLLLEACLELFATDLLEGIQDMGAAGLTSSSVEMAGREGTGLELWLDAIPRRARAMQPYELLLSESQERMLMVAKKGREQEVLDLVARWDLDAAVVGVVTDTGRWVVTATPGHDPLAGPRAAGQEPVVVCDLPVGALTDDAPVYDRPRAPYVPPPAVDVPGVDDPVAALVALLGAPEVGSRAWVHRQFDSRVRGSTVVGPGHDAAIVRAPCEKDGVRVDKLLAFALDGNGRFCALDPEVGGQMIVAEVTRNLACAGAVTLGLTDGLNFASPEVPETADAIARCIDGIAAACRALDVPIVSGNVSLYNETVREGARTPILPTPILGAVGLVERPEHVVRSGFRDDGDVVFVLGEAVCEGLGGSAYACRVTGVLGGPPPRIDLAAEVRLQRLLLRLAREGVAASAHDVADGGLLVALAEACLAQREHDAPRGVTVDLPEVDGARALAAQLFGEAPSRAIVSVRPAHLAAFEAAANAAGVPASRLGTVGGDALELRLGGAVHRAPLRTLADAHARCLDAIVAG